MVAAYINVDDLEKCFEEFSYYYLHNYEDLAPVVHAHNKSKDGFLCSACTFGDFGLFNHGGKYTLKYCPNCGAKMDEEVAR